MDNLTRLDEARRRGLGDKSFKWQEPEPLSAGMEDGEAFPVDALGDLQAVVSEIVQRRKVPAAMAAVCTLSVASYAVQGCSDVETLCAVSPTSLLFLTSGVSGERKSVVDRMLTTGVMDAIHELQKRNVKDAEKAAVLGEETPELPSPALIHQDLTTEGLVSAYKYGFPSLYACTAEGGNIIGGSAMNSDNRVKTAANFSRLWDGGTFTQTRRGQNKKPEIVLLHERRMALHFMGQPPIMASLYSDPIMRAQGLMARALTCFPNSTIGKRGETMQDLDRAKFTPECDTFGGRVKAKVLAMKMPDADGMIEREIIRLSPQARELALNFSNEIEKEMGTGRSLFRHRATANKMPEQACRIAGSLAGFNDEPEISGEVMGNAIRIATYFLSEAVRLGDASRNDTGAEYCERIAARIASKGGTMRRLDLLKNGPKPRPNAKTLDGHLRRLSEAGWIRISGEGSDREIALNPRVQITPRGERGE